jgi:hypothetical protein
MSGCLLTGSVPVLGDRYERGGKKVSEKKARTEKLTTNPTRDAEYTDEAHRGGSPRFPVSLGTNITTADQVVIWPA